MGEHAHHAMHAHSRMAWESLEIGTREWEILGCYRACVHPLTDREVMERLGLTEPNQTRPRITGLIDKKLLIEVGSRKDHVTGRTVRICTNATIF